MTTIDLTNLKKAYYSGVLRVREGNSWVEYQDAEAQYKAITRLEAELSPNKRVKTQFVSTSKGYQR